MYCTNSCELCTALETCRRPRKQQRRVTRRLPTWEHGCYVHSSQGWRKPMRKATPGKVSRQRYYTRVCWKKARLSEGPRKENKPKLPHKRCPERSLKELPLLQNC